MSRHITVAIPTIPSRGAYLARAIKSVSAQDLPPTDVVVSYDFAREGAGPTRTRALAKVTTEWTAFLDDDDEFNPNHLSILIDYAERTNADLVYPWFDVIGGTDPFPMFEGRAFNPNEPNMFPVTVLVRTDVIKETGGFPPPGPDGDDWPVWLKLVEAGANIEHVPVRTWKWHHHGYNTSGLPDRW